LSRVVARHVRCELATSLQRHRDSYGKLSMIRTSSSRR
jgi:hypothetical protein